MAIRDFPPVYQLPPLLDVYLFDIGRQTDRHFSRDYTFYVQNKIDTIFRDRDKDDHNLVF